MDDRNIRKIVKFLKPDNRPLEIRLMDASRVFEKIRGWEEADFSLYEVDPDEIKLLRARLLSGEAFGKIADSNGLKYPDKVEKAFDDLLRRIVPEVMREVEDIDRR